MSVQIAHKLIGGFLQQKESQLSGHRETVAVFCFYSSQSWRI